MLIYDCGYEELVKIFGDNVRVFPMRKFH